MKWMEIKDIFKKEVGEAPYVDMMETVDGKPKGACLLEFKDKETARKAIEKMHRYKVKDRQIVVREEKESDRQMMQQMKNQQQQHSMGAGLAGPGPMGMGGMGNCGAGGGAGGAGPSPQLLQNLGIEGPLTNTVFVANLDYKVTWKKLKDVFKLAGNVLRAEIKQDKDGKSRGMGIVTFEHPMEAVQAISMFNSQTLYDRAMVVRMDKTSVDTSNDKTSHPKVNLPSGLKSIGMGLGLGGQPMQNFNQMSGGGPMGGGFGGGSGGGSGSNYGGMGAMGSGMGGMGNMGGGPMNNYSGMSGMGGGMENMGGGMGGNMGGMSGGMNTGMGTGMSGMAGNMSGGMLPGNMGMSGMAGMSGATNMGSGAGGMGGGMGSNMGSGMGGGGMGSNMTTGSMGAMGMSSGMSGGGSMGGMGGGGGMGDGYGMGANNLGPKNFGSNQGMGDTFTSNMSGMGGLGSMGGMMGSMGNQGMNMSDMSGHGLSGMDGRTMMKNMSSSGSGGGGGGGGSSGRDDCHIVVRNLPHSFTWQMLRERFRDVGDVKYAEIKTDGGKSRGWGVVRFATPEDAQRAVNLMNRARIEGREIEVRIDRV